MQISSWYSASAPVLSGYIAGTGEGIASMATKPAPCLIYLLDTESFALLHTGFALDNGHYLIRGLDPDKRYLLLARDPKGNYEPVAYDDVQPKNDLSHAEQEALWQQMLQAP